MKVLENNYNQSHQDTYIESRPYPRKHICVQCRSKLEYDKQDLHIGALGSVYLTCPLCNYENMMEDHEHTMTLTKDNIEFPIHFF